MSLNDAQPKKIRITELALRDAHQSLLATRMKTEDMLPVCEAMDKVGYWSIECWGGATFDSCLRFLDEDPWERLRQIKKLIKKTPLQMLLRGQNILGYRHYADDVLRRFVDKSIECGMGVFRIFDALNDMRNLQTAVKAVLEGGAHAQGAICYTISPVHTFDKFVELAQELEAMGCQSIVIKDMAALMCPTPVFDLVKAIKAKVKAPLHIHTHATTGVAPMVLLRAIEAGADGVDTAISSLSLGPGHVPTEAMVESLKGTPLDTGLDQEAFLPIADHFRKVRLKYSEHLSKFLGADPRIFISQIPGGMLSNLESQLRQMDAEKRMDEVMHEIPKVRKEMGYIPLVTPTSQIVGVQAVMNVLMGGRYKSVPQESKDIFAGKYGKTPVPVDPEIQKQVLKGEEPITCRPADLIPNEWDRLKAEIADKSDRDEDVLSYALFPKVWLDFWAKKNAPKEEAKPAASIPASNSAPAPASPTAAAPSPNGGKSGKTMKLELAIAGGARQVAEVTFL
jgi:pyruvate/oxaloacetate carboxyltransferase